MKNILAAFLICLSASAVSFAQAKCFENDGLKESIKVEFTITGSKVSGWFYETPDLEETKGFELSGTHAGNNLTVKFADNKNPPWMPKGKNWIWTLVPATDGKQILRMNIYGQNYETKKYSIYPVDFEPCMNSRLSDAKRVNFAKGATSAQVSLSDSSANYLLSVKKGQFIGVVAPGCSIEIYYPNGDLYGYAEEDKAVKDQTSNLDMFGTDDGVPQSGNALITLKRAGDDTSFVTVVFLVKNTSSELDAAIEQTLNKLNGN